MLPSYYIACHVLDWKSHTLYTACYGGSDKKKDRNGIKEMEHNINLYPANVENTVSS